MPDLPSKEQDKYGAKAINREFTFKLFVWEIIAYAVDPNDAAYFNAPGFTNAHKKKLGEAWHYSLPSITDPWDQPVEIVNSYHPS